MVRPVLFGSMLLLCVPACKEGDKVPGYVDLSTFTVQPDPGEGSSSSNIPHAWAYAQDQLLGVWEAGSEIPVLAAGNVQLKLIAGVERNGSSADLVQYPFYDTWSSTINLVPGQRTSVLPAFEYYPDLSFWIADFTDIEIPFTFDVESDTDMIHWDAASHPDDVMPGEGSAAAFFLDEDHPRMKGVAYESADLDGSGNTWLELNYRSDHRMLVGMIYTVGGLTVDEPYVYIAPTVRSDGGMPWKKIHIDLTPFTNNPITANRKFYIAALLSAGDTNARFWIDNVKLVRP
ncbi:MAG: hypothetical protein KA230_04790 [Flavobacteriales bacterium]|nr:hypothetical protein [Flavobacteriales bacterium]